MNSTTTDLAVFLAGQYVAPAAITALRDLVQAMHELRERHPEAVKFFLGDIGRAERALDYHDTPRLKSDYLARLEATRDEIRDALIGDLAHIMQAPVEAFEALRPLVRAILQAHPKLAGKWNGTLLLLAMNTVIAARVGLLTLAPPRDGKPICG